jgi:hypothetical protein
MVYPLFRRKGSGDGWVPFYNEKDTFHVGAMLVPPPMTHWRASYDRCR